MIFGLEKKYKKRIDAFLLQYPYAFYVYGSRSRGTQKPTSDLDLCIFSEVPLMVLAEIKEGLNNLMLPITVDLVAWHRLSDEFKSIIEKDLKAYVPDPLLGAQSIELSYPLSPSVPQWPGSTFAIHAEMDFPELFRVQKYEFSAGIGTHIDTPSHMIPGGADLGSIEVASLCAPCSLFVAPSGSDHSFVLTEAMIREQEDKYGPLAAGTWFLVMTGWGKRSADPITYQNIDQDGHMRFPTIGEDAADYLVQKKILGVGIDTLSPDGDNSVFTVHRKLLGAGIFIIENVMYHDYACSNECFLQVVPLRIVGGAESPVRVLLIKQNK